MLGETLGLIRKLAGRDTVKAVREMQTKQAKKVENFLKADFASGNFNVGVRSVDDDEHSCLSDGFGDW